MAGVLPQTDVKGYLWPVCPIASPYPLCHTTRETNRGPLSDVINATLINKTIKDVKIVWEPQS